MELFDLEIPIRSTGAGQVKADFQALEQAATSTSAKATSATASVTRALEQQATAQAATAQAATESAAETGAASDAVTQALRTQATQQTQTAQAAGTSAARVETAQRRTASAALAATRAVMQQEAQQRANAQAAEQMAQAQTRAAAGIHTGMATIREDVVRASAAFKAGSLSAEQYRNSLLAARQEAQALAGTTGALSGPALRNFNAIMAGTAITTKGVGTGLATVRTGLATVAATAIGATGAMGSMSGAMLTFASGTGPALAVVAALAAVAVGYRVLTRDSRKAAEEQDALVDALRDQARNALPDAAKAVRDLAAAHRELAEAQRRSAESAAGVDELARLQRLMQAFPGQLGHSLGIAATIGEAIAKEVNIRAEDRSGEAGLALNQAQMNQRQAIVDLYVREAELLAETIALRGLDEKRKERALALQRFLNIEADKQILTIPQQNELLKASGALTDALTQKKEKQVRQGRSAVDLARDEVALLVEMGQAFGATDETVDGLRDAIATLERMQRAANVTDRDALNLHRARAAALQELTRLTSAALPPQQPTFGRDTTFAPRREPGVDRTPLALPTFGPELVEPTGGFGDMTAPGETLGSTFADGIVQGIEAGKDRITAAATNAADAVAVAAESREAEIEAQAEHLGSTLSNGIANALVSAASGGNIVAALGTMVQQFGAAVIVTGKLMAAAMKALASLNPIAAIAAGVALVALGSALRGAASESFGGGGVGTASNAPQIINIAASGARTAPAPAPATAGRAPTPVRPVTHNWTVIGADSPKAQSEIMRLIDNAGKRGL